MPSTARSASRFAARIRSGVSKTSSNFRSRTGPIVGSMLSAMLASVGVMTQFQVGAIHRNRRRRFGEPPLPKSERNLVLVRGGGRCFRWRSRPAGTRTAGAFFISSASAAATRSAEHLHIFPDDFELGPFLSGLLVIPRIELKPALDKNRAAFFQIFTSDFRGASPKSHVHEGDLFAFLAVIRSISAVDRQTQIRDGCSLGVVSDLWFAGEVSEEDYFIETGHAAFLAGLPGLGQLFRAAFLLLFFRTQLLVMLPVNFRIELELRAQLRDELRVSVKNEIHVMPRIELARDIGELALV